MEQLIERAMMIELADQIAGLNEEQIETLANLLYDANATAALQMMKAIGFEDMESILEERHGMIV